MISRPIRFPNMIIRVTMVVVLAGFAVTAVAHPGHGSDGGSHSPMHYATEPPHSTVSALTIAVVVMAVLLAIAGPGLVVAWRRSRQGQ
ncbi:hypothetical protein [Stratiformator vulcanicus]|uniref:Uncharacterized protein n=1 Tax=Stratiformator vulcanicus TaxID=2527980 RepID=A0A517R7H5_9PLAN|nr:hypothetical protein [Stratiformator vulcanicus]QDT39812.1 hypothetical protein Pan189_42240 [Stratiformator vulcanicus]